MTIACRLCVNDFANGSSKIHTAQIADGATLDLSALDVAWTPKSVFSSSTNYVTFAQNARIAVEVGGRSPKAIINSGDPYLVKWGTTTPPDATTKFNLSVDGEIRSNYRLYVDATGLKLGYTPGTVIIVR